MKVASELRAVGWLLLSALPVLMIGAGFWKLSFQQPDLQKALEAVFEHRRLWLWIHGWLAAGALVGAAAITSFAEVSSATGERIWAKTASTLFSIGVAGWLASITYRVTVALWVAEAASAGTIPPWFAAAQQGSGIALGTHLVLAHVATMLLARSIITTAIAPRWVAWTGVTLAALGLLGLLISPGAFSAPLIALIYPFVLGIALVRSPTDNHDLADRNALK